MLKKYIYIRNNIIEYNVENINNDSIKKADDMLNKFHNRLNRLNNKILKIKKVLSEKKYS